MNAKRTVARPQPRTKRTAKPSPKRRPSAAEKRAERAEEYRRNIRHSANRAARCAAVFMMRMQAPDDNQVMNRVSLEIVDFFESIHDVHRFADRLHDFTEAKVTS